ncbi:hypothetical protein IV203_031284 [Nitzschia inconspicua]|uniref:WW domain-containing protein n=1 Tax=Nitzschia inconspicua TaxID=303405 RepID=A0A9K3LWU5_9STRA|nr:hypothetical protein IV203_031284 [Nitzschia inconspicua]
MDQGNFTASSRKSIEESKSTVDDGLKHVYTKKGLQAILGVTEDDRSDEIAPDGNIKHLSIEQMEMAMTSLEDEDDVRALRGAQQEAADELREFDENVEFQKASDDEDDRREGGSGKEQVRDDVKASNPVDDLNIDVRVDENDLEKEFAAWQSSDEFDRGSFEMSLSPMERYGLRFHENIDPFYSIFFINEERRRIESTDGGDLIDIEELEREKAMEERQAMEDGDLLSTNTKPEELIRQRNLYRREKARLRSDKKRRQLKGEDWSQRVDGLTQQLFWYNEDTGEAVWDTPRVVAELQEHDVANKEGWSKLPMVPLVHVMGFLSPFPDRQSCSIVCQQWRMAANDIRFVRHVYPVEMGALAQESNRRDHNHFLSISDAVDVALPGDTIELSDGHYYINEPGLIVDKPLKLVGDENNPANVVIELSGSIQWSGTGGWIEGITFRRPKIVSGITPTLPMLEMKDKSKINMIHSVFDNEPSLGCVVALSGTGNKGDLNGIIIRNGGSDGIQMNGQIHLKLTNCTLRGNVGNGMVIDSQSSVELNNCKISENKGYGVRFAKGSTGIILSSHFAGNAKGVLYREMGCNISCSSNTARVSASPGKQIPGFKVTYEANLTPNVDE